MRYPQAFRAQLVVGRGHKGGRTERGAGAHHQRRHAHMRQRDEGAQACGVGRVHHRARVLRGHGGTQGAREVHDVQIGQGGLKRHAGDAAQLAVQAAAQRAHVLLFFHALGLLGAGL